jgi:NSS family neurotransmitter:Na+ symporter
VPLILVVILAGNLLREFGRPYEGYSWASLILIGWNWVFLTLIVAVWLASRPWKTGQHKAPGRGGR